MQGQADTPTPTPTPTSSPTTTLPQVREGLRTLEFSRSMLLAMAEATPDEHLYQRPAEGASHAA